MAMKARQRPGLEGGWGEMAQQVSSENKMRRSNNKFLRSCAPNCGEKKWVPQTTKRKSPEEAVRLPTWQTHGVGVFSWLSDKIQPKEGFPKRQTLSIPARMLGPAGAKLGICLLDVFVGFEGNLSVPYFFLSLSGTEKRWNMPELTTCIQEASLAKAGDSAQATEGAEGDEGAEGEEGEEGGGVWVGRAWGCGWAGGRTH